MRSSELARFYRLFFILGLLFFGCEKANDTDPAAVSGSKKGASDMDIKVTSSVFEDGERIPSRYTCDGQDISPPVSWQGVGEKAVTVALICDDPDAPMGTWVHWVVWNIPADTGGFDEAVPADDQLENGARQGITSFGTPGYGGPCPPSGTHRYYFKVYALDTELDIPADSNKEDLLAAMEGHILAQGQLMGRYARQ